MLISTLFILLIISSLYDLKYKEIPTILLLLTLVLSFFITSTAILNAAIFIGLMFIFKMLMEFITKREVLGEGDFFIFGVMGALFGISSNLLLSCLVASVIASIMGFYYYFKNKDSEIPFLPALTFGTISVYLINPVSSTFINFSFN